MLFTCYYRAPIRRGSGREVVFELSAGHPTSPWEGCQLEGALSARGVRALIGFPNFWGWESNSELPIGLLPVIDSRGTRAILLGKPSTTAL